MRTKLLIALLTCTLLAVNTGRTQAATLTLFDFALHLNGAITILGDPLPAAVNASGFDFATGLGSLTITLAPGVPGDYFVGAFFDHEIDESVNTFFNEFGAVSGTPAVGQSWEIDEPGFVFGDIFTHILAGTLDNTNSLPAGADNDVSMAMGWNFHLNSGQATRLNFLISDSVPTGFFLSQTDPDSQATVYFSSQLQVSSQSRVVPEPGTVLLMGSGLVGLLALRRKRLQPRLHM
jgi:hypothetical protein